jgi:hypothetical protein
VAGGTGGPSFTERPRGCWFDQNNQSQFLDSETRLELEMILDAQVPLKNKKAPSVLEQKKKSVVKPAAVGEKPKQNKWI